jgi:hypothetical protein
MQNQQINHDGFTYTKKNFNLSNYQMDCKHKRSSYCPTQMRYPVVDGNMDMMNGWIYGKHSQKCHLKSGFLADGCPKDSNDYKKLTATEKKSYTNQGRDACKDRGICNKQPRTTAREDLGLK